MIVERDFPDHPKTVKLCRILSTAGAPLFVLRIWAHCEQRRTDQLPRDPEDIAAICRWDGPARTLVKALLTCKWLDDTPEAYVAHGWRERNASWLAKIEGGKKRAQSSRGSDGRFPTKQAGNTYDSGASPASDQLTLGDTQLAGQLAGEKLDQQTPSLRADAGRVARAVEWSGVELSIPPTVPQGGPRELAGAAGPADLETLWLLCCGIFGRKKTGASFKVQHALAELQKTGAVPLADGEPELIAAFYVAARRDTETRAIWHPRDTAETLAENLLAELDKARQWARETGWRGEKTAQKNSAPAEPEGWREWLAAEFPGAAVPAAWMQVPESVRSHFHLSRNAVPEPV